MLRKILLLTPVCLALSACMIYAPTYVSETSSTVVHYESTSTQVHTAPVVKQETNEVSKRVVSKPSPTGPRLLAVCGDFTLPREVTPDMMTPDDMDESVKSADIDAMLATQVKELQTYIGNMHSKIEQAHRKWMESCQQKLLD